MIGSTSVTLCNRALAEMGARVILNTLDDPSTQARACKVFYEPLRQMLLRAANWNFAKRVNSLALLGNLVDSTSPAPWPYKYLYPTDCARLRYLLDSFGCGPSAAFRWEIRNEPVPTPGIGTRTVILSVVNQAQAVYTGDITDPSLWDSGFEEAFVMALASKLIIPLSGNVGMKQGFIAAATDAVINARAADGNEGQTSTDHTPDWISARNLGVYGWGPESPLGDIGLWYQGWAGFFL